MALKLLVRTRSGGECELEAKDGLTVMEIIRDAGFDEVFAICGGSCSCGTCHVLVAESWFAKVGPPGMEEGYLLESARHRARTSRLACQIRMTSELHGLQVTIAPEE